MSSILNVPRPAYMTDELLMFRETVDRFVTQECLPHMSQWRKDGRVDRGLWRKAGEAGLLMVSAPVEYGGGGGDFAHEAVICDSLGRLGAHDFLIAVQNLMIAPYILRFASEEQKRAWVPRLASGEWIGAIAMTEPNAGSDLAAIRTQAVPEGDAYVINGQKTFTTLGEVADLIMVACKTDPEAGSKGISLFIVEAQDAPGLIRGRKLDKIGLSPHATSELFFDNLRVPAANLLGGAEGLGFKQLMLNLSQERVTVAIEAIAMIERALGETVKYVKERKAFGTHLHEFQNTRFVLAECKAEATIGKVFVDACIEQHIRGELDAVNAAIAKLWLTELQSKIIDRCLQLFGGYGYMNEYPIAQMYKDCRVSRIYGGTSEIMKVIIAKSI
jgi:acyl-CoA dehydrogenase